MKKIELFVCEICGTQYAERLKAKDCEANHKKPVKIASTFDTPKSMNAKGYPCRVNVLFDDGAEVTYRR